MNKPLDLADKYEPLSYQDMDDEPTVKMYPVLPKVIIDGDGEDDEPTIPDMRAPIQEEKTYPGIGLLIALGTGLLFWGTVIYFIWGR